MNLYRSFVFPLLRKQDPETAHHRALAGLQTAQRLPGGLAALRALAGAVPEQPVEVCGVRFPNALGLAAGFDKDVLAAEALGALGFGHIEAGTLTPHPQAGNPKPRLFRLVPDGAVINRMGFPNGGVDAALPRLRALAERPRSWRLGISLGKQKETPLENAADDYLAVMEKVHPYADYLAVNISSPNTPGLRELQGGQYLRELCARLQQRNGELAAANPGRRRPPLFVKIAPDVEPADLDAMLATFLETRMDGIIATNTTLSRAGATDPQRAETGGLSGAPLRARATEIIRHIHRQTAGRLPIIGVGGIAHARDAAEKLDAGAVLVQLYTAMVFEGPGLPGCIVRGLRGRG